MYLPTTTNFSVPRLAATTALLLGVALDASAATLSVGPGRTYAAPCAAIAVARDGDTIEIAGNNTYSGDTCVIQRNDLTIRGVNGRPKIDAAGKNAKDKGIWVVTGNNLTVDNVEMFGARVMSGNGAAFRLEGTNFTLRNSFLHDNENGILSNVSVNSDILVEFTEFGHNGHGDGQTHNLYIGHVKSLTFRYNYSHDANVGHNLKSRADTNTIVYNRFSSYNKGETGSTAPGRPSYEIDLPNAGTTYIIGNIIQQPALNENATMVAYGEEGATNAGQDLYVVNNTFLNDSPGGATALFISGNVTTPALIQNNLFTNIYTVSTQAAAIQKSNLRSSGPGFLNRAGYDLHPDGTILAINTGTDPGTSAKGVPLAPVAQYKHVANGEARPVVGALDIGAFEVTSAASNTAAVTWTQCAVENGNCAFSGTGPTPCTTAVFADPAPGVVKSCSYSSVAVVAPAADTVANSTTPAWTLCSLENETCTFWGSREVRFGANGVYTTKVFTDKVQCTTANFGDPTPNVLKSCSFSASTVTAGTTTTAPTTTTATAPITTTSPTTATPVTWTTCAKENGVCSFSNTREVRYGVGSKVVTKVYTKSVQCSNSTFGDPAYGTAKSCSYSSVVR
jgi:hypothetical protein